jgi:uncharacterized protein (DUF2267 family)
VLGAVLHALRDRPQIGLAVHLGAQLPLLVRGLYYDQWRPSEQTINSIRFGRADAPIRSRRFRRHDRTAGVNLAAKEIEVLDRGTKVGVLDHSDLN